MSIPAFELRTLSFVPPAMAFPALGELEEPAPPLAPDIGAMPSTLPPHDVSKAMMAMDDNAVMTDLPLSNFIKILLMFHLKML